MAGFRGRTFLAVGAALMLGTAVPPAGALTMQSGPQAGCPGTAPIAAWARRNGYSMQQDDIVCGDFNGDGAPDAVALLASAEEWGGNSMPPYAVVLFRNVNGNLQHLRTVSTPDNMTIFGTTQEPARFERGRIILTHRTMMPDDARCCPSGVTAYTIDTNSGRVTRRLVRQMSEAEQNGGPPPAPSSSDAAATPSGWRVERNENGSAYAIVGTGLPAVPELRMACSPSGSPIFAAMVPGHPANAHLNLTFASGRDRMAVLDINWQKDPSSATWVNVLRDPTVPNLLGGDATSISVTLNGRLLGNLSLAGSTRVLREALASCWQAAPGPNAGASASASPGAGTALTVDIVLTPRAAAELSRRGESITVATMFSGTPRNMRGAHVDDHTGELDLGMHEVTVPGRNGPVEVPASAIRRDRFSNLRGEASVLVNVYSARRTDQNNLLDCGIVSGTLTEVAGRAHRITCALIGER